MLQFLTVLWIGLLTECPFLLLLLRDPTFDARTLFISNLMLIVALAVPYLGFGDPLLLWSFVLTQILLFSSFVCVSRIRQRSSLFLMAAASIGSNAGWFLAAQVLASAYLSRSQAISSYETHQLRDRPASHTCFRHERSPLTALSALIM
jgi:hypothetical protein